MSKQDRGGGRQKGFSFRLPSWASATQRSPSQRQPSRVTTTTTTTQPLPPSPPQQRTAAAAAAAPARRSSRATPPTKPQMGTAPSRPASEPYPTRETRAPPSVPSSSSSQPPARAPSRQLSRTFTQPPQSPPSDRLQPTTLVPPPPPRGPSPSPPPEQPASPPRPKTLSISIPPLAPPTPPVASSTPPSPPEKAPPSPVQELPAERPPPTTQVLQLQLTPTERAGEMEEEETTPAAPAAAAPTDMPIELESRPVPPPPPPPAPAAAAAAAAGGDEPMVLPSKSPTTILTHPSADFTSQPRELETPPVEKTIVEELTPTRDVGLQDTATPPKPETEQLEGREGDQPVIRPEAGRESTAGATLPRDVEETPKPEQVTEGEREKLQQHQPLGPSDRIVPKDMAETKPGEPKEENGTLKTIPVGPTPDQEPHQIKTRQLEEAPTVVEAEQRPTQVSPRATQPPIKAVEVPEAGQPPVPPPPPPLPSGAKGKEGKIAISTLARTSTSSREQSGSLHKEIKEGISRLVQSLAVQHSKQPGGGERGGISIITLAGENQGASMFVGRGGTTSTREGKGVHVHNGRDVAVEDVQKRETGDKSSSSSGSSTSVNSNVQTINNSILHESCCSEDNPGVHVVMSTRSPEESAARAAELMQKSRCRAALPQKKLGMEPTVRRRCLRALFLESSDDDAQKPRRHGCRFGCADDVKKKKAINGGDHAGTSLSGVNTTTTAADQGKKIAREGV